MKAHVVDLNSIKQGVIEINASSAVDDDIDLTLDALSVHRAYAEALLNQISGYRFYSIG